MCNDVAEMGAHKVLDQSGEIIGGRGAWIDEKGRRGKIDNRERNYSPQVITS